MSVAHKEDMIKMQRLLNPIYMFLSGLFLGTAVRMLDIYTQNLGEIFSQMSIWILIGTLIAITAFVIWCIRAPKLHLLHKLYLTLVVCYAFWVIPVIIMQFMERPDGKLAFILDCLTQPGGMLAPPIYLCIALAFVRDLERMPRWMWLLFVMP